MSFVKGRNLTVFIERFLKRGPLCCGQGSFFPKVYIHSSCIFQRDKDAFGKNYKGLDKATKNFGEVVDLGDDFNTLEEEGKKIPAKRRTLKKNDSHSGGDFGESSKNLRERNDKERDRTLKLFRTYEAVDSNDRILNSAMTALKSVKGRKNTKEIVLEGKRIISEAIAVGLNPKKIFFTRSTDLENLNIPKDTPCLRVSYKTCQLWSDVETSQGVIGIFGTNELESLQPPEDCMPLTIICDNIRDPGNMGSILRVASGAGCEKVILTTGCVDVWNQKVLRSSAGAHFNLQILKNLDWPTIENEIDEGSEVFVADGNCLKMSVDDVNESSTAELSNKSSEGLPIASYFSIEFKNTNTVIIIGGETHGISQEACGFAQKRNGMKVFIPMHRLESLNAAVALGIISYEYKRQFDLNRDSASRIQAS